VNMNTASERFFRHGCSCLLALAIMVITIKPVLAETQGSGEINPDKVFAAVQDVAEDLETLRTFMGASKHNRLTIDIREAAPHDVYFQALALFEEEDI